MKLDKDEILYLSALQNASNVVAKDCIIKDRTLIFLVQAKQMGKVIGKGGKTIKELSKKMNKKIEIIAYYDDVGRFLENALKISASKIETHKGSTLLRLNAMDKKRILLNKQKLNIVKEILKRHFEINDLRIR